MRIRSHTESDEDEVAAMRALLSTIVVSTEDAVVSVDMNGQITSWNAGAESLYGIGVDDAMSASFFDILPTDVPDMARALGSSSVYLPTHREVTRKLRNGEEKFLEETISLLKSDDGEVFGAASISRDITSRRETEKALEVAQGELATRNARLERSNADLEQFAYIASHDLSEPLRAVAGMVQLLQRRYQDRLDDDADEFIGFAVEGCARMKLMIDDLLAYARAGSDGLKLANVSLNLVIDYALRSLSSEIESTGAVVDVGELPTLRVDQIKLTQVIQNILSNALKFRSTDRALEIQVRARREEDKDWRIEISDNGIGVEPEYRTKVFRMFQRLHTRDTFPGTGIGLAIAERIIIAHGGVIGLEESAQGGVTVWFTIPTTSEGS
jgi:PAS domain S-box-containing protein